MDIEQEHIEHEIERIGLQVKKLEDRRRFLEQELWRLKSRLFIKEHRVVRDEISKPAEEFDVYFWNVWKYVEHLRGTGQIKRFALWNGRVHLADDLLAGTCDPERSCLLDDVPEAS